MPERSEEDVQAVERKIAARSAAKLDHSATLRAYAEQLPVVLSVPNLREALRDAADEIDRLREQRDSCKRWHDD